MVESSREMSMFGPREAGTESPGPFFSLSNVYLVGTDVAI